MILLNSLGLLPPFLFGFRSFAILCALIGFSIPHFFCASPFKIGSFPLAQHHDEAIADVFRIKRKFCGVCSLFCHALLGLSPNLFEWLSWLSLALANLGSSLFVPLLWFSSLTVLQIWCWSAIVTRYNSLVLLACFVVGSIKSVSSPSNFSAFHYMIQAILLPHPNFVKIGLGSVGAPCVLTRPSVNGCKYVKSLLIWLDT